MLFVEGDAVGFVGGEGGVGARDEGAADGDLGGEADDGGGDGGGGERVDGRVDVAGVGGQERAEDEEDFARAVGGGVAGRSGHWGLVMGAVGGEHIGVVGGFAYKSAARAMSSAFCRLAWPLGSWVRRAWRGPMWSLGLPLMSLMRTARPSRMPMMPSWEMGFCSKNSVMNSWA